MKLLTAALVATFALASGARADCSIGKLAELPVDLVDGLVVTGEMSGRPVKLTVMSNANFSSLTPDAAARLQLQQKALPSGYTVTSNGRKARATRAFSPYLKLGGATFQNVDFVVLQGDEGLSDGQLGQDILGKLDVEYDLAHSRIRLLKPSGCEKSELAYWAGEDPYSVAPVALASPLAPSVVVEARLNGKPIKAMLRTDAPRSLIQLSSALAAGARLDAQEAVAVDPIRKRGAKRVESYVLPFESFTIGDETIRNTRIRVAKLDLVGVDMILGADFLLSHRVLVAHSQRRLYFTHAGGPVFRLDPKTLSQGSTPGPPTATDLLELQRSADVAAMRGDRFGALAQLDAAIAQSPSDPQLYLKRAAAKIRLDQLAAAKEDLDQVIRMTPDQALALELRGEINLRQGREQEAEADFAAALASAPDAAGLRWLIAGGHTYVGKFEKAIAHIDQLIAAKPKSIPMQKLLNGRCWNRALWGRDLDAALDDCNRALRAGGKLSEVLDSRGMVYLRRGQFKNAIADYDESLRLQPKQAWSLYGRGLARLKIGDRGGAQDIASALAISPEVADKVRRYGLSETTIVVAQSS